MIIHILDQKQAPSRRQYLIKLKFSHFTLLGTLLCLAILMTACAPQETIQPTLTPSPSRTPVKLGPTSTISPLSPTEIPPIPSATLVPIPPISDADWSRGPVDASFTFVVYSDFQ